MKTKGICAFLLAVILTLGICSCAIGETSAEKKYNQAVADVETGKYEEAIAAFESLKGYEDSVKYIMYARCRRAGDSGDYENAIKSLTSLGDFKEASLYVTYYTALSYEAKQKYEKAGEVYDAILFFKDVESRNAALPDKILDRDLAEAEHEYEEEGSWRALREMVGKKYTTSETQMYENIMAFAAELHEKKEYEKAANVYALVKEDGYEKADAGFKESVYQYVRVLMTDGKYSYAGYIINEYLLGYKDADELLKECSYQLALEMEARGAQRAQAAYDAFKALDTYKDSADRAAAYETKYAEAVSKREANELDAAIALFTELGTYSDSSDRLAEAQNAKAYAAAVSLMNDEKYEEAIEAFKALNGYSDSVAQIEACEAAISEREYQKAEELRKNGQYAEAYAIYLTIRDYKDVDEIITNDTNIANIAKEARRAEYQPGNYVTFGTYPQTKAGTDNTPIEWLVLESDGETALLISRYALDSQPYNTKYVDITWEKSTLRSWLNNEFYNRAFSEDEKQSILTSSVSADKNPSYSTNPGNATKDNVFLLSIVEANKYFESNEARMCAVTDYAIKQGAYTNSDYKVDGKLACWVWLRSPGYFSYCAARVYIVGSIRSDGYFVNYSLSAVRPCVRFRLF